MKKNKFLLPRKPLIMLMLMSFFVSAITQAQLTGLQLDQNADWVSDDTPHQTIDLIQDDYSSVKDTGDVVHYIPTPNSNSQGLTWDGSYLWCSDISVNTIYQVNPEDAGIIKSFDSPGEFVEGLAWDRTYLWASENGGGAFEPDYIYKIDPEDGSVINSLEPDVVWIHGLTWDGQYLWVIDFSTHLIHKVNSVSGDILHTIDAPSTACIGLTWDGSHLWTDDFQTDKLYCINPDDGSVIYEVTSPHTNPRDLAWDGDYLWVLAAAASTIYQVDVGYSTSINELDISFGVKYTLSVYPNPIEKLVTISYALNHHKENIQLNLYNSRGVLIKKLVNSDQLRGNYKIEINAEYLVAGIYYCVVQARQESIVKKLIKIN